MTDLWLLLVVVVLLIVSISRWNVHPFLALLVFGLLYGIASGIAPAESVGLLMEGFANTLKWIAVIMIFGAMIGEIANETGGAERIAHATLRVAGEKRLPAAMGVTGYVISIPVFVDVAYIMMQSVTEALAVRSERGILVVGLSLVAGLTATHALMPPTPGPLAVAGILDAQLGRIILINFFVALSAMTGGVLWAVLYCKRIELDYDRELQKQHDLPNDDELAAPKAGARIVQRRVAAQHADIRHLLGQIGPWGEHFLAGIGPVAHQNQFPVGKPAAHVEQHFACQGRFARLAFAGQVQLAMDRQAENDVGLGNANGQPHDHPMIAAGHALGGRRDVVSFD